MRRLADWGPSAARRLLAAPSDKRTRGLRPRIRNIEGRSLVNDDPTFGLPVEKIKVQARSSAYPY